MIVEDNGTPTTTNSVRSVAVRAVLFDLDGTLVDTESLSDQAILMALQPYLNQDTWNTLYGDLLPWELKKQLLGLRGSDWAPIVIQYSIERWGVDSAAAPAVQELWDAWEHHLNELCEAVEACPGAYEVVERLASKDLPMAVATSSRAAAATKKLRRHPRIADCMKTVVAGDDPNVVRGKPSPDIYLEAAKRLHISPEACLVFEDALSGCQAAKAAGCVVVAVPDTRFDEFERATFEAYADVILHDLHQFDESMFEFISSSAGPES